MVLIAYISPFAHPRLRVPLLVLGVSLILLAAYALTDHTRLDRQELYVIQQNAEQLTMLARHLRTQNQALYAQLYEASGSPPEWAGYTAFSSQHQLPDSAKLALLPTAYHLMRITHDLQELIEGWQNHTSAWDHDERLREVSLAQETDTLRQVLRLYADSILSYLPTSIQAQAKAGKTALFAQDYSPFLQDMPKPVAQLWLTTCVWEAQRACWDYLYGVAGMRLPVLYPENQLIPHVIAGPGIQRANQVEAPVYVFQAAPASFYFSIKEPQTEDAQWHMATNSMAREYISLPDSLRQKPPADGRWKLIVAPSSTDRIIYADSCELNFCLPQTLKP